MIDTTTAAHASHNEPEKLNAVAMTAATKTDRVRIVSLPTCVKADSILRFAVLKQKKPQNKY